MVLSEMETSVSSEKLDKIYQKCLTGLNENLQDGLGLGSFILKPLGGDKAEFVTADKFVPISFGDDGKPTDIAFFTLKRVGENDYFTRVERHYFEGGNLVISNKCYHSQDSSDIGQLCSLEEVEEWKNINPGPVMFRGMQQMDFGYYRNPIKNNIDGSACGVSIFDAARERIKKADLRGSQLDWEYESGERAIHVATRALKHDKATGRFGMARLNKRLYRGLELDAGKDQELLKEYSPELRDEAYKRGLEEVKREIEFIVGLAYGDLSDVQEVSKTATEIKVSKQRKYNRVNAIDYASGRANRIDVAARRAIMTGVSQITGKITDYNAEKLGADHFEVAWHSGARPTHAVWQGKVWTREQLVNVCGLGSATGLLGINCYHEYYLFFPGISERNWTDEWLEEQNRKEK